MKSINDIINEVKLKNKSGRLKKIYILTLMIPYQMWKEYNVYDDFFSKLSDDELNDWESFIKWLEELDDTDTQMQFSSVNMYYDHINKLADYILSKENNENEQKIWKEIKTYITK